MRALLTIVILVCIGSIVYGNYHWKDKVASAGDSRSGMQVESKADASEKSSKEQDEDEKLGSTASSFPNLPMDLADFLIQKEKNEESVELLLIGSSVLESGEAPWTALFKQELEKTFGDFFQITVQSIAGEVYTSDVVEKDLLLHNVSVKPDIVILEPFLLDSNGYILIEDSLDNIEIMIEEIEALNPDVYLFLQPGQPIYNASYYPNDVAALKDFANEKGITYIDHWTSWPDYQDEVFNEYIIPDSYLPNEKGHELWAGHLVELFAATN